MQEEVFGLGFAQEMADALLRRLGFGDGMGLLGGRGRPGDRELGPPGAGAGAEFAGTSWAARRDRNGVVAGSTERSTAARARSALVLGKRLIHSDSTQASRSILERAGLVEGLDDDALSRWVAG